MHRKLKRLLLLVSTTTTLLVGCSLFSSGLSTEEQIALDYVTEMHATKDRDLTKLMMLTGKKITQAGLAEVEIYLTSPSTAWIGSANTENPNKKKVYLYFSPEATKKEIMKGIYVEKKGERWLYAGDIAGLEKLPKKPFAEFEESKEASKLGVKDWTEVELKVQEN